MTSTIKLFDKAGNYLDEITDIPTTPRTWILNAYGRCTFSMPLDHEKLTERNFRFGNLIYIEHIPGGDGTGELPPWGGIILPQRTWNIDAVEITAFTGEAILAYRALPYVDIDLPISEAFKAIVGYAGSVSDNSVKIQVGRVIDKDIPYTDSLKTNAYDHIAKKLMTFSGNLWSVTPQIDGFTNTLSFSVNYLNLPGVPAAPYLLNTTNTQDQNPLLTEQGTIINHIFAYTQASTPQDRQMVELKDFASIRTYGEFQANLVYVGQTDISTLSSIAASWESPQGAIGDATGETTTQTKFPAFTGASKLFKRVVLNRDTAFSNLRVGSVLQVDEQRVGFNPAGGFGVKANIRITSMSYDDTTDKVDMVVEVI